MNLKGTKSEKNILEALAGESKARNKYTYYALKAHEEGHTEIAKLFEKMADNEMEHAKIWFKMLNNGLGTTEDNLQDAAKGENYEWISMYPTFAKDARAEGLEMLATMFERVAAIEQSHEQKFLKEYVKFVTEKQHQSSPAQASKEVYQCMFCGYTQEISSAEPPVVCPVCQAIGAFEKTIL